MKSALLILLLSLVYSSSTAQIQGTPRSNYVSQHVGLPLEEMEAALRAKQKAYDAGVKDCQEQLSEIYDSIITFPVIQEGWHSVNLTGLGVCNETTALVKNGKVTQIVMNGDSRINVSVCTAIQKGKCTISLVRADNSQSVYFKVVFLEDLLK